MKTTGSLEASDAAAAAVAKTDKRVTLESMLAKIADQQFFRSKMAPELTICVMKLTNGFTLVGKSAPADPANFNQELDERFAREDCIRQLWPLEGYLLRENEHVLREALSLGLDDEPAPHSLAVQRGDVGG